MLCWHTALDDAPLHNWRLDDNPLDDAPRHNRRLDDAHNLRLQAVLRDIVVEARDDRSLDDGPLHNLRLLYGANDHGFDLLRGQHGDK